MQLTLTIPYTKSSISDTMVRPLIYLEETVVSEIKDKSVTVKFSVEKGEKSDSHFTRIKGLERLIEFPFELITKSNVVEIWETIKPSFYVNSVPRKNCEGLLRALTERMGYYGFEDLFVIIRNQEGWGYMGGVGCGQLIHKLHFHKVMGPRPERKGDIAMLATLWFNLMLGEVKDLLLSKKYLRDAIKPEDVFVTLNARPTCQQTVRYRGARGYVIKGAQDNKCNCKHCAARLGLTIVAGRPKVTPDQIVCGAYKGRIFPAAIGYRSRSYQLHFERVDGKPLSNVEQEHFFPKGQAYVSHRMKATALAQANGLMLKAASLGLTPVAVLNVDMSKVGK